MSRSLPDSHLRSLSRLVSRRLPATVILAAVLVGTEACRTADQHRVVAESVSVVRSVSGSTVVERVPGGRPGGRGDPRRYPESMQNRGTVDPAGTYDLSFTDDGTPITGTMVVEGTPGEYTGKINAEARPEVKISTVTASGPQVTVTGDVPNGVLLLRFRITGDSLRGDWSLRGDGGRLIGKHHPVRGGR